MPKYSAKQRKMRGQGRKSPPFMQLFHYVKRSTSYHGLSLPARALLTEIHDRYNGSNNGMIALGRREIEYELHCGAATACRAMSELDDSGLARPLTPGAWRCRYASEWRLMWLRCDKTGDLPRTQCVSGRHISRNSRQRGSRYRMRSGRSGIAAASPTVTRTVTRRSAREPQKVRYRTIGVT